MIEFQLRKWQVSPEDIEKYMYRLTKEHKIQFYINMFIRSHAQTHSYNKRQTPAHNLTAVLLASIHIEVG